MIMTLPVRQVVLGLAGFAMIGGGVGCARGDPVSAAGVQGQVQRITGDLAPVALPGGSATVFAPATGTVRVPDSVRVTLRNLTALSGGAVYKTWLVRPDTGSGRKAFPIAGRYVRRVTTTTYDSTKTAVVSALVIADSLPTPVSSFVGGAGTITFTTQSYSSTGATVADTAHTFLISIENDASATTPSDRQPLWVRVVRRATDANNGGGNLAFGTFWFDNGLTAPIPYSAQGRVNGGVLGDSVKVTFTDTVKTDAGADSVRTGRIGYVFVGSLLQINLQGLQRPPIGYRYVSYLCRSVDDLCAPTDTSARFTSAGSLSTLGGQSLADADTDSPSPTLTRTRINEALLTYQLPTSGETLCTYDRLLLTLEPKLAIAGAPLAVVFSGQLPELVRKARSCQ